MAKRKAKVNKSAAVRVALKTLSSPSEIVAALKLKGITVSPQMVSTIKAKSKAKNGKATRRGRPVGSKNRSRAARGKAANGHLSLAVLLESNKLVKLAGSVEAAQEALAALRKLRD